MKTWKQFLEGKGLSEDDFAKKTVEEMAALRGEFEDQRVKAITDDLEKVKETVENSVEPVDKAVFTPFFDKVEKFLGSTDKISNEAFQTLEDALKAQGAELKKIKEGGADDDNTPSIASQIKAQIEANQEAYDAMAETKGASMAFTIKAPGTILTSTNLTPAGNRIARNETEAGRVGFVRRNPFMTELVSVGRTNSKVIYWVELVNEDGTVAMTAEGAAKAQIDYDYVESSAQVRKATAYMKASKEMMADVDNFVADVEAELVERILLFVDDNILNGDGTGENLVGVAQNATAFAAGSVLANAIDNAQEADVLRAAVAQVIRSEFYPTAIVVHPDMAAKIDLIKKTDDGYVMKPFMSADGMSVAGIPVVVNTNIGTDDFFVGDFTKYKLRIREDINIQFGYENDDWTKNLVTPLAEMRLVGFIPANHYGAIVTGTFTAAAAALETA